jgi:hypothetical protein
MFSGCAAGARGGAANPLEVRAEDSPALPAAGSPAPVSSLSANVIGAA